MPAGVARGGAGAGGERVRPPAAAARRQERGCEPVRQWDIAVWSMDPRVWRGQPSRDLPGLPCAYQWELLQTCGRLP